MPEKRLASLSWKIGVAAGYAVKTIPYTLEHRVQSSGSFVLQAYYFGEVIE